MKRAATNDGDLPDAEPATSCIRRNTGPAEQIITIFGSARPSRTIPSLAQVTAGSAHNGTSPGIADSPGLGAQLHTSPARIRTH